MSIIKNTCLKHLAFLVCFFTSVSLYADTHTSMASGFNFNSTVLNQPWDVAAVPATGDDVVIETGHTVTMTVGDRISSLTIEEGGQLIINAGRTLRVDNGVTLKYGNGQPGAIISGGGTLRLLNGGITKDIVNDGGAFAGGVNITVANVRLNADINFNVEDDGVEGNVDLTITSVIHDQGTDRKLTKSGLGSMTLSGTNTFTDDFRFYGGVLNLNNAQAIGLGGAANNFDINGGTVINNTSGGAITLTSLNRIRVFNSFTFTGTNDLDMGVGAYQWRGDHTVTTTAGELTMSGIISDVGDNDEMIKNGAGTLTLSAANSMEQVILSGGQLNINHAQALGDETGAAGTFVINAGTTIDNTSGGPITSVIAKRTNINGSFTFLGSNDLSLGTGAIRWNGDHTLTINGSNLTLDGIINDVGNNDELIKDGAGTLTLTKDNTHDGTILNAGTLNINHGGAIGGENKTIADPALEINGGVIDNTSGAKITFDQNFVKVWNADWTFTGTNDMDMGGGATRLTDDRIITVSAGELTLSGTVSDDGSADDHLEKSGDGTLTLAVNNNHDRTILNAGTLNINAVRALGGENGTNPLPAFVINGGTIDNTSGAKITLTRAYRQQWNSDFIYTGTNDLDMSTGRVELTGDYTVTTNGGELTIDGQIVDAGDDDDLIKAGAGTLTLKNNNTHQSTTLNAGTLNINHASALGSETGADGAFKINGGTIDNTSGAAITLSTAYRQTWGGDFIFTGTDDLNMSTGAVTMTASTAIGVTAGVLTQDGVIGGAFSLTKNGAGTLELNKANTFTGGVTFNAGVMNVENASSFGTVAGTLNIAAGAVLDNTAGGPLTMVNYPQVWNGDFTFTGTSDLNMGTGTVNVVADVNLTTTSNVLTVGGVISGAGRDFAKSGVGTLSFGSQAVGFNDVTISAGTLTPPTTGTGIFSISGNFVNNSTMTLTTGKIDFTGATAQTVSGSTSSTIYDVEVSGGGGLILSSALSVSNLLTLTSGIVSGSSLLTLNDGATSNAGTSSSYVTGTIRKFGTEDNVFPVGDGIVWAPLELSNYTAGDGTTAFDIKYNYTVHPLSAHRDTSVVKLRKVSKEEYWDLDHVAGTAPTVDVTLHWKDWTRSGTQVTGGGGTDSLVVAHFDGTHWESYGVNNGITHSPVGSVTAAGVSSFSPFTFGSLLRKEGDDGFIALPVELVDFTVEKGEEGSNLITWVTASEINNDYFVIQRSIDGVEFEDVYLMPGQGTSLSLTNYSYVDSDPPSGAVYYRLKQIDFDEEEDHSEIVQVENVINTLTIYPNPVNESQELILVNSNSNGNAQSSFLVQLVDVTGKIIHVQMSTEKLVRIPIRRFNVKAGHYIVRLVSGSKVETRKLIIR